MIKAGDYDGALAGMSKYIDLQPVNFADSFEMFRGYINYMRRDFSAALTDFQKTLDFYSAKPALPNDFIHSVDKCNFNVWLCKSRMGDRDAATQELRLYLDNRKVGSPNDYFYKLGLFLTGQLSEVDLLNSAVDSTPNTYNDNDHCIAYFYVGAVHLLDNDKNAAEGDFEKCLATKDYNLDEYQLAQADLKALGQGISSPK